MRPSIRFEVFKRDGFMCSYCGRRPPEVVLEVDHIVPRASGGGDEMENLITACADCNRGKGARHLDVTSVPAVSQDKIEESQERTLQLHAYAEAMQEERNAEARLRDMVLDHWCTAFGGEKTKDGWKLPRRGPNWPSDATLRIFLKKLPLTEIFEAIDVTADREPDRADRYFYGVCWKKIRKLEEGA